MADQASSRNVIRPSEIKQAGGPGAHRARGDTMAADGGHQAAELKHRSDAEAVACRIEINDVEDELKTTQGQMEEMCKSENQTRESAGSIVKWARIKQVVSIFLMAAGTIMIHNGLAPVFYGQKWLCMFLSFGAGLLIFTAVEVMCHFLNQTVTQRQFDITNTILSVIILSLLICGYIQFNKASSIRMEIASIQSVMAMGDQTGLAELEKAKNRLVRTTRSAMLLLFMGLEWMAGISFYMAKRQVGRFGPITNAGKRIDVLKKRRLRLHENLAKLEKTTAVALFHARSRRLERKKNRQQLVLIVVIFALFLIIFIGFFSVSDASANRLRCFVFALDVTPKDYDEKGNAELVEKVIWSLRPGDEFLLALITQSTFKDPQIILWRRMPVKAGFFSEALIQAQNELIAAFRRKHSKIHKNRPFTCLIEGLFLFTELLRESQNSQKILILASDMQERCSIILEQCIAQHKTATPDAPIADVETPDMQGITVFVVGVSTAGLDARTWNSIKQYWLEFFQAAKADIAAYTVKRQWPVKLLGDKRF